jgi:hypothetical protein
VPGRLLAPRITNQTEASAGYWTVDLAANGKTKHKRVHVLVAEAFLGPRPPGRQCCHKNGNGLDNRAVNLRWGTPSENIQDSVRHGTHPRTRRQRCPLDHELAGPNLDPAQLRRGYRSCRACDLAATAVRRQPTRDRKAEADWRYSKIMPGAFVG